MPALQFEVKAKENSIIGGTALNTGFAVAKGDRLIIKAAEDDTWACGGGDMTSNANGLIAGNKYGGVYGTMPAPTTGGSFPFGSLVGSLDGGQSYFLIGTTFDAAVAQAGTLCLCFWDGNSEDNIGSITVSVDKVSSPVSDDSNSGQPAMTLFPSGTQWSVGGYDNNGTVQGFHPVPWEFDDGVVKAGTLWTGQYKPIPGNDMGFSCEITHAGSASPTDTFAVFFVTPTRFIGTKNGSLYRFGKKI
jgi:hypothetical protein